jgi:hypothetical protein
VISVSTPPLLSTGSLFARSADLTVRWDGSALGSTVLAIITSGGSNGTRSVECTFSGADRTGVVPGAALAQMPEGPALMYVYSQLSTSVTAGDFDILVRALRANAYGEVTLL